jgi:hypothetical protein
MLLFISHANNIFYCKREETPSIKRSFLSILMVVETLGIEELSPWATFVHHMLGFYGRLEV